MISAVVMIGRLGHIIGRHFSAAVVMGFALQILAIAAFLWWTQYLLLARRTSFVKLFLPTLVSTVAIATVVTVGRQLVSGQIVPAYHAYGSVGIGIVLSAWMAITSSASSIGLAIGAWLQMRRDEVRTLALIPESTSAVAAESPAQATP